MATSQTKSKRTSPASAGKSKSTVRSTAKKQSKRATPANRPTASKKKVNNADGSLLREFFLNSLKDIYWAEKALTKALPRMEKESTSRALKTAFNNHLKETQQQIQRLEQVFQKLGETAKAKKCEAMQGLIEESESIIAETKDDTSTRDAALIIAAQKVEHYEIATYGGLVQLAKTMNENEIAKILQVTLNEEKKADETLTKVAENSGVNEDASQEPKDKSLKENIISIFTKDN